MRIPLNFNKILNLLTASSLITIPSARITLRPVEFLVDTGSNITFLDENDINRLQISHKLFSPSEKQHLMIGGGTFKLFEIKKIILNFKTDLNQTVKFELPHIEVGIGVRKHDTERGVQTSILGMDFIVANKLILHIDTEKNEYYLEKSFT